MIDWRAAKRARLNAQFVDRPPDTFYWEPQDMPRYFRVRSSMHQWEHAAPLIRLGVDLSYDLYGRRAYQKKKQQRLALAAAA